MVTEEQKDKMGAILFGMIAVAMKEVNHHMAFPAWQVVDKETRASYMNVVNQLVSIAEVNTPVQTEVKEVTVEKSGTALKVQSNGVSTSLQGTMGSPLLDAILSSDPAHPVTISRPPPEVEKKQKVAARMAKARAALKEQKERRLAVA